MKPGKLKNVTRIPAGKARSAAAVCAWPILSFLLLFSACSSDHDKHLVEISERLDAQERRLDRIYNALEPHLEEMEEQSEKKRLRELEDAALRMDEVFTSRDIQSRLSPIVRLMNSPSGPRLVLTPYENVIQVLSVPDREELASVKVPGVKIEALVVHEKSGTVYFSTAEGGVYRHKPGDDEVEKIWEDKDWPIDGLAVSPDGSRLAWAVYGKKGGGKNEWQEPEIGGHLMDLEAGTISFDFTVGRADYQPLSFSPDGQSLAVLRDNETAILDARTGDVRTTISGYNMGLCVCYSPDGSLLAIGDTAYNIRLWGVSTGETVRRLEGHTSWVVALEFTRDSKFLCSSGGDLTGRVWNVGKGKEAGRLRYPHGYAYLYSLGVLHPHVVFARNGEYALLKLPD